MVVYTKVEVGVPGVDHARRKGAGLFVRARTTVLEAHDMHLQDPGFSVARDQIASIATGACCAKSGGATREQVAGRRVRRRTVVGAMVQLVADVYRIRIRRKRADVIVSQGSNGGLAVWEKAVGRWEHDDKILAHPLLVCGSGV